MKPLWLIGLAMVLACSGDVEETASTESSSGGWESVSCGSATCENGDVCVQPGLICEYQPSPHWVTPAPYCAAVPEPCRDGDSLAQRDCLAEEYCDSGSHAPFEDGTLQCNGALDCF